VVVNRVSASGWETFKVYNNGQKPFLRSFFYSCLMFSFLFIVSKVSFLLSSSLVYGGPAPLI
jgi:hypothetical protein